MFHALHKARIYWRREYFVELHFIRAFSMLVVEVAVGVVVVVVGVVK